MDLTSVTYTSLAKADLQPAEIDLIERTAQQRNVAEGITGLLIFNGTHFLQIVEGGRKAVDSLLHRLRGDSRHCGLEIRDEHNIKTRSFPEWPMEMVRVRPGYFAAREAISERVPETVPEEIRLRLLRITELISTIAFD